MAGREQPDDLGDTLVLRPSLWKHMLMLAGSLGFVAIGVFIMPAGDWTRWLVTGFFGLCAAVFVTQLLPGASYLKLDREGFEFAAMFRKTCITWSDVSPFAAGYISANKMVLFELTEGSPGAPSRRIASIARNLAGAAGALPDTYGMKAEALADLMNRWRDRALSSHP